MLLLVFCAASVAAFFSYRGFRYFRIRKLDSESVNQGKMAAAEFLRLDALVHQKEFYRDPKLDRTTICSQLGIGRHALNQLLNDYAGGLSVPAYINKVRLDVACDILKTCPGKTLADIAGDVGMSPQNFRIQFKNTFGLTPNEYRQAL